MIRRILPSILFDAVQVFRKKIQKNEWSGKYKNWDEAALNCAGYSNDMILDKVRTAVLKVKNGEAVYERDSVLFDTIQYSWPLLSCLQNIALENDGHLHLIDFGGSLGSSYFQNKHFISSCKSVKWVVVEQEHFVEIGKSEIEDENLKFEFNIEGAITNYKPNAILISSVLQYLQAPEEWIKKLMEYNFESIIIDRTGFINAEKRLTLQEVPEYIYKASYPCWFFNEAEFLQQFSHQYRLIAEFDSYADREMISEDGKRMYWKGFYFKRRS